MRRHFVILLSLGFLLSACKKNDDVAELKAELEKLKQQNEANELEKKLAALKGGTIKGSVFVVTKGGTNFKLGLVPVSLAEADAVATYVSEASNGLSFAAADNKSRYETALAAFQDANARYEEAVSRYRATEVLYKQIYANMEEVAFGGYNDANWEKKYGASEADYSKAFTEFIAIDKLRAVEGAKAAPFYTKAKAAYDTLRTTYDHHRTFTNRDQVATLLAAFPTSQSTKTNADGAFSFTVDKGKKYIVVAAGQREIGNSVEQYYWVAPVELEASQDDVTLMLSNDNMVEDVRSLFGTIAIPSLGKMPDFEFTTIVTEPKRWTITDQHGNKREVLVPDPQPRVERVVDKTKFPRTCVTIKRITVATESGISSVPSGTDFELVAPDGEGFKGTYNGLEFAIAASDFAEKM